MPLIPLELVVEEGECASGYAPTRSSRGAGAVIALHPTMEAVTQRATNGQTDAQFNAEDRSRARALSLISRAALLLANLGEREHRVSWLLQDCIDLLQCGEQDPLEELELDSLQEIERELEERVQAVYGAMLSEVEDNEGAREPLVLSGELD